MKRIDSKMLVITALLASFVCVATMIIQIPNGIGGYLNLGDCIVLLCGWLLGPVCGAFAAGIGSMLADIFATYVVYAPATLIIKSVMPIIAYYIFKAFKNKSLGLIISGLIAEIWMVIGYFVFEGFILYGFGTALIGVFPNIIQGLAGTICACILKEFIDKKGIWKL